MAHISYYLTTISPYCYLAGQRLEEIAKRHGAQVVYKPLDVGALFERTGGVKLADRHPSRQEYRLMELERWSKHLNLPLNLRPMFFPTNPAPSSYALIAAQNAGGGDLGALAHAFMRAVWADEKDIADDAVIRSCLEGAGFDPALADSGLLSGAETYSRNLDEALADGAFGAPFYVTDDGQRFWGQDRLDALEQHLSGA